MPRQVSRADNKNGPKHELIAASFELHHSRATFYEGY